MPTPPAATVLITVDSNGTVDYCTVGEVKAVLIDYRLAHATSFPDVVDAMAREVKACPPSLPWRQETVIALKAIAKDKRTELMARLPVFIEEEREDHPPDAG